MTEKVRLVHVDPPWAWRADSPRGSTIGYDLVYSFPVKYQSGGVYDSLAVCLEWRKENDVTSILEELRPALSKMGLQVEDESENEESYREVWFAPTYSSQDNVRKFWRAVRSLGWEEIKIREKTVMILPERSHDA